MLEKILIVLQIILATYKIAKIVAKLLNKRGK